MMCVLGYYLFQESRQMRFARNRAKRRLRALARAVLPEPQPTEWTMCIGRSGVSARGDYCPDCRCICGRRSS